MASTEEEFRQVSYLRYMHCNFLFSLFHLWKHIDCFKEKDYELFSYTAWCKEIPEKGIILEVDLEYPEELHDLHSDYPCAPEKILVTDDTLLDYCRNNERLHGNSSGNVKKVSAYNASVDSAEEWNRTQPGQPFVAPFFSSREPAILLVFDIHERTVNETIDT